MATAARTEDLGRLFCDLVMKGGITSGVVYPTAVAELSNSYRFRSIGGASAGAIAAAGAAAAEYRRQTQSDPEQQAVGFNALAKLHEELRNRTGVPERSRLFRLFVPTRRSRPLFSVLVGVLNRSSKKSRLVFGILALLRAFPLLLIIGASVWVLASLALLQAFFILQATCDTCKLQVAGLGLAFIVVTFSVILATVAVTMLRSFFYFVRVMSEQDFGLCTGMREDKASGLPALTEWLNTLLQSISGKALQDPLTFGDLRHVHFSETPGEDGIVLRMMTTCLTAGRPFTLPIRDERYYFDPIEMRKYFPEEVVAWMESHPWPARANCDDREADARALAFTVNGSPRPLKPLPEPDHFPVVVGVRMSLSFPILLSAIPLYRFSTAQSTAAAARTKFQSVEQEAAMRERNDCMERMYFTDGGICSNLPVHLFDSPLPKWPTFAINLRDDFSDKEPASARVVPAGRGLKYQHDQYDIAWKSPTAATVSFGLAILSTMQNWRDALQRGAAGFRERVFTVRHTKQEGGLNLDMQIDPINRMATSGTDVADRIREAFLPKAGPPTMDDWLYHRWVRIRLLLPVLEEYFAKFDDATRNDPNQPTVFELLADSQQYLGDSFDLNPASRTAADRWLRELDRALTELRDAKADLITDSPRPGGTLRVTPTY